MPAHFIFSRYWCCLYVLYFQLFHKDTGFTSCDPLLVFHTQPIDYEGFQLFMATYLENDLPEELCQHLFTSFKSKSGGCSPDQSRAGTSLLGRLCFPIGHIFFGHISKLFWKVQQIAKSLSPLNYVYSYNTSYHSEHNSNLLLKIY